MKKTLKGLYKKKLEKVDGDAPPPPPPPTSAAAAFSQGFNNNLGSGSISNAWSNLKGAIGLGKDEIGKPNNSTMFHIYKDGHRITDTPMTQAHIEKKHGPIQNLIQSGHKVVPHEFKKQVIPPKTSNKSAIGYLRTLFKKYKTVKSDPLQDEMTSAKGVSQSGIEARRSDTRNKGILSHGFGRTTTPERHRERAIKYFKDTLNRLKKIKPNLP